MGSLYLNSLSREQRKELERRLLSSQKGNCFICEKPIDPQLHADSVDIDHVEPIKIGGKDDTSNFAITHSSCNRSKQASDLRVARVLKRFDAIRDEVSIENRGPNLSDVLRHYKGAAHGLPLKIEDEEISFSFSEIGQSAIHKVPLYRDELSGLRYFFAMLPIEYLFHDDRINPRAVGGSLNGLIDEFHKKRPQLQVALAWTELRSNSGRVQIRVFDGQHKATAQVLLGVRVLPLRVFLNPNVDVLLTANTNAGTTLRQIAFDKSVQRHLGSALFVDRIERYRKERGLAPDDEDFSEQDLVNHFKGEWREMRRYILDSVRDSITHHADNKLKDYIDFAGKGKERPLSYSTIEKTFYSFFIYGDALDLSLNYRIEQNENPRELEKQQILKLMNLVAANIYTGKFDPALGTARIENQIQKGGDVPEPHLCAYRLSREEILYVWLRFVRQIVQNYFITTGKPIQEDKLFQYPFPEPLWDSIENFIKNLTRMPLWVNRDLSLSVFGGKQNYDYWQTVFESGRTPQGQQVLPRGVNLMSMIQG
ncbi:MAG: HNH endonuclease [Terriglobales bacterium]